MDTRIALAGQPIDFAGSLGNGLAVGQQAMQAQRANALAQLYQQQGPGLMAGDPRAMNALAQLDPNAAMGMQGQQLGMQAQRQDMAFSAERMQMARDQAKQAAVAEAAKLTAEQRAAEAAKLSTVLKGAAAMYAKGDRAGYNQFLQLHGVDPAQYQFEQFPALAAMGDGVLEALTTFQGMQPKPANPLADAPTGYMWKEPGNPAAGLVQIPGYQTGPDWRAATPQEAGTYGAAAGQINAKTGEFKPISPPSGVSVVTNPDGTFTFTQGPGAGSAAAAAKAHDNGNVTADTIFGALNAAREAAKSPLATGLTGMVMQSLPTSDAAEVKRQLSVLKANASLASLNALRAASKTGGGLGAVSDNENQMLADAIGAVDPNAGPERLKVQMDNVERNMYRAIYGPQNGDKIFDMTRQGMTPSQADDALAAQSKGGAQPTTAQPGGVSTDALSPEELDVLKLFGQN